MNSKFTFISIGTTTIVDLPPSIGAPGVPAAQSVPEQWPIVPVIAVNKHPVFPKFIKIVEVTNQHLMDIIRRKVKLNQPYAGVFIKKNDENQSEVVKDAEELYPIGSFVHIIEMQDLGNKLRMVVNAHRRISLNQVLGDYAKEMAKVEGGKSDQEQPTSIADLGVLMVETENLNHEPYEISDEIKALTQEVIKTIRDIIVSIEFLFSQYLNKVAFDK